jgi:sarcosine oxidase subunit gamma
MPDVVRAGALAGLPAAEDCGLSILPPGSRFIFRGAAPAVDAASQGFGLSLPRVPCRAAALGDRAALWLGPDEFLLLAPEAEGSAVGSALARSLHGIAHALVDVSHRDTAIAISGPDAAARLNAACPLDLEQAAFPVGMCTRTVFGKAGILLWRNGADRFRLDAPRSFAAYVWQLLEQAVI